MSLPAEALSPRRILVINVSRIGDTLLTTPALRALARNWPTAEVHFLGHPKRHEVMHHLEFLASAKPITKTTAPFRGRLGGRAWDLALVYGFDRPLVEYALRVARHVVAFRQKDKRLDEQLFRCVEQPAFQSMHAVDFLLTLTRALGIPDAGYRLAYRVSDAESDWARRTLADNRGRLLVGLQIASFPTKGFRDWPVENFAALAERIAARWPAARFLIFGGELERDRTDSLAAQLPDRATSYAGKLTLRQTAALMNEVDLYIGVDTGPTHLMGALDAPMIPMYHCQSPSRLLAPRERPRCFIVDHPRAAQGCGPETPMAELTVDTVWPKVLEALPGA